MAIPSQDQRIEIWRYTYARQSLIEAREAAKCLLANQTLPDEMKQALACQVAVAYARPFTHSQVTTAKRIVALDSNLVPAEFRDQHNQNLQMRNQTIGHKDATAFPSTALNRVIVRVDDTGFDLNTVSAYTITDTGLRLTIKLCEHLINYCFSKVGEYYPFFVGIGKGTYILNLEDDPTVWIIKKQ